MQWRQIIFFSVGLPFLFYGCIAGPPKPVSPQELLAQLQPHYRIFKPEGRPPYPTVLLFHGAQKNPWREDAQTMTRLFVKNGYAVIFVDSFKGRGLGIKDIYRGRLMPRERAGDLLVTLDWARGQIWCDGNKIAACGHSHGAATIMDALVLAPPQNKPTSLIEAPKNALKGLKAVVLLAPWCQDRMFGYELLRAVENNWSQSIPILAFIPGKDESGPLCTKILERHQEEGLPIEIVHYPMGKHNFTFQKYPSSRENPDYDAEINKDAQERMIVFLKKILY